jgi:agmatine deiminase
MINVQSNYHWPAEWERHAATWIAWPHNEDDWPGKFAPIPWIYVEIVRWLSYSEPVHILVQSEAEGQAAAKLLQRANVPGHDIYFHVVPTNRSWTRDYAPIFVRDVVGKKYALKWRFNGWAKYHDWQDDDAAGREIARLSGVPIVEIEERGKQVVLEGGAIDGNGAGLLMTTEQCLLSAEQVRNPGFERSDYEKLFARWLGVEQVLWLAAGISGDDTHGHVDDVARFIREDTVLLVRPNSHSEPDYQIYEENRDRIKNFTLRRGALQVVEIPLPEPRFFDGQRLPASYANFYIGNRVVLVPTFHDPADRLALNTLAEFFPDREVIGIYSGDLILGLGALHCLTMQEPAESQGQGIHAG